MGFKQTNILKKNKYMIFLANDGFGNTEDVFGMQSSLVYFTRQILKRINTPTVYITNDSFSNGELSVDCKSSFYRIVGPISSGNSIDVDCADDFNSMFFYDEDGDDIEYIGFGVANPPIIQSVPIMILGKIISPALIYENTYPLPIFPIATSGGDLSIKESQGDAIQLACSPDHTISKNIEVNIPLFTIISGLESLIQSKTGTSYVNLSYFNKIILIELNDAKDGMNESPFIYVVEIDENDKFQIEKIIQSNEMNKSNIVFKKEISIRDNIVFLNTTKI